ncbi:S-layer homology domain-containing protein [Marinicrinis lubricantis]|uniref:S-layer homology domain-containing protein n=1 Tax=Marinicrinis lubricantis TaxID=2086470 RepID=A0ABW1IR72_9BACL
MLNKCLMAGLCGLLLFSAGSQTIMAMGADNGASPLEQVDNGYVRISVDEGSGRFSIRTNEGHPLRDGDNEEQLLYENKVPETSFTTFRINGEDYIYGNDYSFMESGGGLTARPQTVGLSNQSVWQAQGLEIVQTLTLVDNPENPNIGNVKISYLVTNQADQAVQVGSRILLDTMLGADDASPISLSGMNTFVQQETEFAGELPYYWRATDNPLAPQVMSYGFLQGWGNTGPDRMVVAHWEGISETKWDYAVHEDLDFTSENNPYGSADSSVALYWEPSVLAPGEQRVYETYYGLGSFYTSDKPAKFTTQLIAPKELKLNTAKDGYAQDPFEIQLIIDNTTSGAEPLADVAVNIGLPSELELVDGEEALRTFDHMAVGEIRTVVWKVKARPQYSYKAAQYWVSVQQAGGEEVTQSSYVILPALAGEPPEVQVHDVLPDKLYIHNERHDLYFKGSGFEMLKGNWNAEVQLIRERDGETVRIQDLTVIGDQQLTLHLDALWQSGVPEPGTYTVRMDAGMYGSFEQSIELTEDEGYKTRDYGIVAVVGNNKRYTIVPVAGEAELAQLKKNHEQVLLELRGKIQEIAGGSQTLYEIAPGATINSVVRFDESPLVGSRFGTTQTLQLQKKESDRDHDEDYIEVSGIGMLSIPSFPFVTGSFSIILEDGNHYALDADDEEESIIIKWQVLEWMSMVHRMASLPVTVKHAVIGDQSVSFGGSVSLSFKGGEEQQPSEGEKPGSEDDESRADFPKEPEPDVDDDDNDNDNGKKEEEKKDPFELSIELDEARFGIDQRGQYGFLGLRAEGEVGLPEKFVPGMDFGAEARMLIDTLDHIYEIEADVSFEIIEVGGVLTIRFTESSIPIVDNFVFYVGGKPGIPLIPPYPVAYITKGGGGFKNMYDTVTGNFEVLPPLKMVIMGGMDIAKIISADDMTLEASLRGVSFEGSFGIMGIDIFERVYGGVSIRDSLTQTAIAVKVGAELVIFDIITGEVYATLSYDSTQNGIMGPVSMAGGGTIEVVVPKQIPFIGGKSIAGAEAELSTEKVYAQFHVLSIPIGIEYVWGSSAPVLALSAASAPAGFAQQRLYHPEDGSYEGQVVYGTNIRRISSSDSREIETQSMKSLVTIQAEPEKSYTIPIGKQDYALLELGYSGEVPNLEIRNPQGELYELTEGINYLVQEIPADQSQTGVLEQRVYVTMVSPMGGDWTVTSDRPIDWTLMDVAQPPGFSAVEVVKTGDHSLRVNWQAEHAEYKKVALYITENNETDSGQLLLNGIDVSKGSAEVTLPETFASGEYYVKAIVYDGSTSYDSMYSVGTFHMDNAHEPKQPDDVIATSIGNGLLQVSWNLEESVDGFYIQVLDEGGQPLDQAGAIEVEGDVREAKIGGVFEDASGGKLGMMPGETYKISVTAYNEVEGIKVFGPSAQSSQTYLPEPDPALIVLSVAGESGDVRQEIGTDGQVTYIVNQETALLTVRSDQAVQAEMMVNDTFVANQSGEGWQQRIPLVEGTNIIQVTAVNEQGDVTMAGIQVKSDTTAPDLKIESPDIAYVAQEPSVRVKGVAEPGTTVKVNNTVVATDEQGQFDTNVSLTGYLSQHIRIVAEDQAGNQTAYTSFAANQTIQPFDHVEIRPISSRAAAADEEDSYHVNLNEPQAFQLVGISQQGETVVLNQENVKWDILIGDKYGTLSEDGQLNMTHEGELVIKASYALSTEYALEDTIIVRTVGDTGGTTPGSNADDWYVPEEGEGGEDGSDNGPGRDPMSPDVPKEDPERQADEWLREVLQSIIEAEEEVIFIQYAALSNEQDTVIAIEDSARLKVFKQTFAAQSGVGVGKVLRPKRYEDGVQSLIGEIYELKTNQPIQFQRKPELSIRFNLVEVEDPNRLGIYWYNELERRWEYIGGDIHIEQGYVIARLPHFSKYALFYNESMQQLADMDGRWSKDAVYRLASIGVVSGKPQSGKLVFAPNEAVTRQEFAKLLVAASGVRPSEQGLDGSFVDEAAVGRWAMPYVSAALQRKWLTGIPTGDGMSVEPQRSITRAEAAVMAANVLDGVLEFSGQAQTAFRDGDLIPAWAADAVARMQSIGIISGYPDQTFRPNESITREEGAVMILNMTDALYREGRRIQ